MLGLRLGLAKQRHAIHSNLDLIDNTAEEIDVIIMLGQSNNDGRSGPNEARSALSNYFDAQPANKFIWHKPAVRLGIGGLSVASYANDGELWYVDLDANLSQKRTTQVIGVGNGGSLATDGTDTFSGYYYGPECEFAYRHAQAYPNKKLVILKGAIGSTKISEWDFVNKTTNKLWKWFLNFVHDPAVAYLSSKNKTLNLLGVTWVQGEADANATDAPNYQTRLQAAVNAFNTDLFDVPPKIILQGLSTQYNGNNNGDIIETAQKNVANATINAVYVEADGTEFSPAYGLRVDGVHYNANGLEQMVIDSWAVLTQFSPRDLGSDLLLWQDAGDAATITQSGGSVSSFNDKSAGAFHAAQGTSTNQPLTGTRSLNGRNGLNFDGSNDFFNLSSLSLPYAAIAIATVFIPDNTNSSSILLGNSGSSGTGTRFFDSNQACDFGNTLLERTTKTTGSALIQICWVDGTGNTNQHLKINNEAVKNSAVTRGGVSGSFRQGSYGSGGNYADHAFFERIIIQNPTTEKLNKIGNYYASKYAVSWSNIP